MVLLHRNCIAPKYYCIEIILFQHYLTAAAGGRYKFKCLKYDLIRNVADEATRLTDDSSVN